MPDKAKDVLNGDIFDLFDSFIEKNSISKQVKLDDNLIVELRTISTEELLEAESISMTNIDNMPVDVVFKARAINILLRAITAINGVKIQHTGDSLKDEDNRDKLREKLLKLPPQLIDKLIDEYRKLTEQQDKLIQDLDNNIENF